MIDIREIIRQLRDGHSARQVGTSVGVDHKTVCRYRDWAQAQGWLDAGRELADVEAIHRSWQATWGSMPAQNISPLVAYEADIRAMRQRGLSKQIVMRELSRHPGFASSYSALCRFIRQIEGPVTQATVRVETEPGQEAQVDFGYAGLMYDPAVKEVRKSWAFVMTLSWSRHQYVEFVFDQRVETWLTLHVRAFEFFGGVPGRIKLDNLKAAIVKASVDDPQVQRSYRELAEHYGFVIAPCRVATPRHKGKVERGVAYLSGNFMAGRDYGHAHCNLQHANADVRAWVMDVAGQRVHGTTRERPLDRFNTTERATLKALPARAYEAATWATLKLQRDCHVVLDKAYYSAPFRLIGLRLPVRATAKTVHIYDLNHTLVATHTRAVRAGKRQTSDPHLPPHLKAGVQMEAPTAQQHFRERAAQIGQHVAQMVDVLFEDRVVDKRGAVGRLLRLADDHGWAALDQACRRAFESGDPTPFSVRNWLKIIRSPQAAALLQSGGDARPHEAPCPPAYARTPEELLPAIAFAGDTNQCDLATTCLEVAPCR